MEICDTLHISICWKICCAVGILILEFKNTRISHQESWFKLTWKNSYHEKAKNRNPEKQFHYLLFTVQDQTRKQVRKQRVTSHIIHFLCVSYSFQKSVRKKLEKIVFKNYLPTSLMFSHDNKIFTKKGSSCCF